MELKVLCDCGQKYVFDVEPIANQMPFRVNCPCCGRDGTSTANELLAEAQPQPAVAPLANPGGPMRLSISHSAPPAPSLSVQATPAPPPVLPQEIKAPMRQWEKADMTETHSLALGFLGAMLGAALGVGVMFGFRMLTGFVMPIIGLSIGLLSGFGARLLYKGTDVSLGAIAAVVTLLAAGATFLMFFGLAAIMSIMVLVVTIGIAYKIAG